MTKQLTLFVTTLMLSTASACADLPLLQSGNTATGASTTSSFAAGASIDGGNSFTSSINPNSPFSVTADIQVESQHQSIPADFFVVARLDGQHLMQDHSGAFIPWDLALDSLIPRTAATIPGPTESFTVFENIAPGPLGIDNSSIEFFFAYRSEANPAELYYSATPLVVTIDPYDPLSTIYSAAEIIDTSVFDEGRDREIPVLIYRSQQSGPSPTILFSHGLGGDRFNVIYLAEHWSARGFNVINLQHPGSDSSIHEGLPANEILAAFQEAANLSNSIARVEDVFAVIDQLEIWNEDPGSALYNSVNLSKIGMSGHSFGARTTMATSGQQVPTIPGETLDPRIQAAVVLSPSPPGLGTPEEAFGMVELPWLLMTGTLDESIVNDVTAEQRQLVYPALPPGGKYELVLFEGEHHAFTDRELSAGQNPRNPAHHGEIMALSTAFWEAWLLDNVSARTWLDGDGAVSTLQPGDTWQFK